MSVYVMSILTIIQIAWLSQKHLQLSEIIILFVFMPNVSFNQNIICTYKNNPNHTDQYR